MAYCDTQQLGVCQKRRSSWIQCFNLAWHSIDVVSKIMYQQLKSDWKIQDNCLTHDCEVSFLFSAPEKTTSMNMSETTGKESMKRGFREREREKKGGVHDLYDASINVIDVDCRRRFMIYVMIYQINRRTASSFSRVTMRSMFFPLCPTGPSSLMNFQRQDTTKLVARSAQDLASYCKNAELDESQLGFET